MRHWVLLIILAVTVAVIAYLTVWVFTGNDDGLEAQEPDGRAVPLPGTRPLTETDISGLRFDTTLRGYRMVQVDAALRRTAYDLGYKQELIDVLEAEVLALREGRLADAEELRRAREGAAATAPAPTKPVAEDWAVVAEADSEGTESAEPGEPAGLDAQAGADVQGGTDEPAGSDEPAGRDEPAAVDGDATAGTDADAGAVQRAAGRR
jgi:DivIVA domain-containing protein